MTRTKTTCKTRAKTAHLPEVGEAAMPTVAAAAVGAVAVVGTMRRWRLPVAQMGKRTRGGK
jgi:hypothetical protein